MSTKKKQILTVLGAGNMGTAVAQVLADNGHEVRLWNWEGDHAPLRQIDKCRENKKFLPGVKLSKNIVCKYKIEEALQDAKIVFFVVPSGAMEHTISFAARSIAHNAILVDVSKGVEPQTLKIITTVIGKHVRSELRKNIVSISGPAVAGQMAQKQYTAMNIASKNALAIKKVQAVMQNKFIKLVPTTDMVGVEIGGSFKNVYAIATGICDGLKLGLNTKAAILTYALEEIADLSKAMGGKKRTAYELAGLGDLIGTSLCPDSRNRTFGQYLGKGIRATEAIKKMKQTVEGYSATHALLSLARHYKVRAPFAHVINACLEAKDPRVVFKRFLERM